MRSEFAKRAQDWAIQLKCPNKFQSWDSCGSLAWTIAWVTDDCALRLCNSAELLFQYELDRAAGAQLKCLHSGTDSEPAFAG